MPQALAFDAYADGHPLNERLTIIDAGGKETTATALVDQGGRIDEAGQLVAPNIECRVAIAWADAVEAEEARVKFESKLYAPRNPIRLPQSGAVSFLLVEVGADG